MNLSGDHIRRVDHAAEDDRAILRQIYEWATNSPALYLEGKGYCGIEDFIDQPDGVIEYFVFADGRLVALLTLTPFWTIRGVYDVGLITRPGASVRKICRLLKGFMGVVFERMAHALYVQLPPRPEFSPTRKLARFFGFKQVAENSFLILKSEYVAQIQDRAETTNQLPGRVYDASANGGR